MSCVLRIDGIYLDVDKLRKKIKLIPYKIYRKGEPFFKIRPEKKAKSSGFSFDVSKADFSRLDLQIKDAVKFLKKNKKDLTFIKNYKNITSATLDFGVNSRLGKRGIVMQSNLFPSELLRLSGNLDIDIELSQYQA